MSKARENNARENYRGNSFWDFFSSVRLTIGILILLAIASVAGTLIPQQEQAAHFTHEMNPALVRLFSTLQLFDVYHSLWFRIIIAALAFNLVICSLDRFPATWKRFKRHASTDTSVFRHVPPHRVFRVSGKRKDVTERFADWITRRYRRISIRSGEQEDFFYAEKGRYSLFGVYLTHLSVLLILTGGIVGSLFGFEARVNIPEGSSIDTVLLRGSELPRSLGFSVRCDSFAAEFYDSGTPKEYKSDLAFLEGDRVIQKSPVLVNHPVSFKGIMFYQASYGKIAGDKVVLRISKEESGKTDSMVEAKKGEPFQLPDGDGTATITEIQPDFMRLGPAAQIRIRPTSGEPVLFWVFLNHDLIMKMVPGFFEKSPRLNSRAFRPYSFWMEEVESKYYTGLQVNRDPGVPLVWIGCFAMIWGFFTALFLSHTRIWVRVSEKHGSLEVSVTGKSNKNQAGLERELERITENLHHLSKGL